MLAPNGTRFGGWLFDSTVNQVGSMMMLSMLTFESQAIDRPYTCSAIG